jgi:two-component system LytT family response regulator
MFKFTGNRDNKMLRTIIIDDEEHQRIAIDKMLGRYCHNIRLVACADGVQAGIKAIHKHHPDLVLLDIKMDDGSGFDLLNQLSPINFKVIFITAYDQYAIKAFRFSALDYLLKPLDPDELVQAVEKAEYSIQKDFLAQLDNLREHLTNDKSTNKKIIIKTYDNIHLVPVNEILYCEADGNYVHVHLAGHPSIMVSSSLKEYNDMLTAEGFFRVHKSYLVNMKYIRRFEKAEGGFVILDNKTKVPVASRKRDELLEIFEQLTKK